MGGSPWNTNTKLVLQRELGDPARVCALVFCTAFSGKGSRSCVQLLRCQWRRAQNRPNDSYIRQLLCVWAMCGCCTFDVLSVNVDSTSCGLVSVCLDSR